MKAADPYVMFEENLGLAYGALQKYFPLQALDEDLQQIACIGLWKACQKHDPRRGEFSTFAYKAVWSELMNHFVTEGRKKRRCYTVSTEDEILTRNDHETGKVQRTVVGEPNVRWLDFTGFMAALRKDRHRDIVQMRIAGMEINEIAAVLNIHRQTVREDLKYIRRIFERYI